MHYGTDGEAQHMKKILNIVVGGLQQKIFNLVLITILLMAGAYTAVILYQSGTIASLSEDTTKKQEEAVSEISSSAMHEAVTESLRSSVVLQAEVADAMFRELRENVSLFGSCAESLFAKEETVMETASPVSLKELLPDAANDGKTKLQLLGAEGVDFTDEEVLKKAAFLCTLSDIMTAAFEKTQLDTCFIGTPDGLLLIADSRSAEKIGEDGKPVIFPVTERPWYKGAAGTGELYFTDVEYDLFSERTGIVCSYPVYVDGELKAVVGADLFLDAMAEGVEQLSTEGVSYIAIVNQYGHVVFSPRTEGTFAVRTSDTAEDLRDSENEELAAFVKEALVSSTEVRLLEIDGRMCYAAGAPLETAGWTVINVVDQEATERSTQEMLASVKELSAEAEDTFQKGSTASKRMIVLLVVLISAAGLAAALGVSKRIVKPLNTMTKRIASLRGDNIQFKMEDTFRTGDEIEVLATSFADLSAKTVAYIEEVARVTAEKERIGAELEMAQAIQESQLPSIFPPFPGRPEFDIYASMTPAKEVGGDFYDFFLIDSDHLAMVMADVSGKGVPAALFMMIAKILIKNRLQSGESLGKALQNVNNQLLEGNQADMFVTTWLSVLTISTGEGTATNAGHEHPVLRRADGTYELVKYRHYPAVATLEDIPFKEHTFKLNPGDSLFVYTDGVAEAANPENELFGTDRLLEALNRDPDAEPDVVLKNVMDEISAFVKDAEQFDDITMLCLRYNGPKNPVGQKNRF